MSEKALNIKNGRAAALAREVALLTGENLTEAVTHALEERLKTIRRQSDRAISMSGVHRIQELIASLPERDPRSSEDILGYDEFGLPS